MIFPNAAIVHIIRDPLDMLISCYRNKFDDRGLEWSFSIKHLVLVYKQYLEIMHHWQEVLPRNRIINIRY